MGRSYVQLSLVIYPPSLFGAEPLIFKFRQNNPSDITITYFPLRLALVASGGVARGMVQRSMGHSH